MKAKIFEIKRFAVQDGDGIRTTVFFKGCPLKCVWCHNPEGLLEKPQLAFYNHKCINCGECVLACPTGAHSLDGDKHFYDRQKCIACGKCQSVCLGNALTLYGKEYSVEQLLPILLEDKDFYQNSGGGVTLSGGECLIYADFCAKLLQQLKQNGVSTAVDTCGFVQKSQLDKVIDYTDVFLYDVKAFDQQVHFNCTGQSNKIILENLLYLDKKGCKIEVRIPLVPQFNLDQVEDIARFLSQLKNLTKVRVLAYHNYAGSKYSSLGMNNTLPQDLPTKQQVLTATNKLKEFGLKVILP